MRAVRRYRDGSCGWVLQRRGERATAQARLHTRAYGAGVAATHSNRPRHRRQPDQSQWREARPDCLPSYTGNEVCGSSDVLIAVRSGSPQVHHHTKVRVRFGHQ